MTQLLPQPNSLRNCANKDEVLHLAATTAQRLLSEHRYNLPRLYVAVKRYETYLKELVRQLQPATVADARQRRLSCEEVSGAVFRVVRRDRIDYSQDARWEQLQGEIDYLTDQRKAREAQLRERPAHTQEIDHRTGELRTIPGLPRQVRYGLVVRL